MSYTQIPHDIAINKSASYYGDGASEYFSYDSVSLLKEPQRQRCQELLDKLLLVDKAILAAKAGQAELYFQVTAGAKAGTIMRLKNVSNYQRYQEKHKNAVPSNRPEFKEAALWRRDSNAGSFSIVGHWFFPSSSQMIFEVEGRKEIIFSPSDPAMTTMKPALLLGYQGPTVWKYGKPDTSGPTMRDRYGQTVKVGDVVLLGQSKTGILMAGKIEKISDKKTVWIKHIGAKESHKELGCQEHQILLLKDIEQILMIEKLKSL